MSEQNIQDLQLYLTLEKIEDLIEESPRGMLSMSNKRSIDCDKLLDLISDLKVCIPNDLRRAQGIILDADDIIADSEERARGIAANAEKKASVLVNRATARAEQLVEQAESDYEARVCESEIYTEAQRRAKVVTLNAQNNANKICDEAKAYADSILVELTKLLEHHISQISSSRSNLNIRTAGVRVENVSDDDNEGYVDFSEEDIDEEDDYNSQQTSHGYNNASHSHTKRDSVPKPPKKKFLSKLKDAFSDSTIDEEVDFVDIDDYDEEDSYNSQNDENNFFDDDN